MKVAAVESAVPTATTTESRSPVIVVVIVANFR